METDKLITAVPRNVGPDEYLPDWSDMHRDCGPVAIVRTQRDAVSELCSGSKPNAYDTTWDQMFRNCGMSALRRAEQNAVNTTMTKMLAKHANNKR